MGRKFPFFRKRPLAGLVMAAMVLAVVCAGPAAADLQVLADAELAEITGHGFSSFTLANENGFDVARMLLDVRGETWTEVDRLQMGHWNGGWDQHWNGLSLGAADGLLRFSGLRLEAVFTDVADSASRRLQRVTFGYASVTGTITVDLASFTGTLHGTAYQRADLGPTTITLDHEPLELTVDVNQGLVFRIGN